MAPKKAAKAKAQPIPAAVAVVAPVAAPAPLSVNASVLKTLKDDVQDLVGFKTLCGMGLWTPVQAPGRAWQVQTW